VAEQIPEPGQAARQATRHAYSGWFAVPPRGSKAPASAACEQAPASLGTPTVISSVSRVADDTALGIMTACHRALSAGSRPAEALALVIVTRPHAPLTPSACSGTG
jgi:hypothetical protein